MNTRELPRVLALLLAVALAFGCAANGAQADAEKNVAARVGDETISFEELDKQVQKDNAKAFQQYYDARRAALDALVTEKLVAAEAASRGISQEELQREIIGSAPEVAAEQVEAFYNQNKSRMGNQTLEQARANIRNYLMSTNRQKALGDFVKELKKKAGVEIYLTVPRLEVKIAANDPAKGPEGAPILLVEYSDFQ